LEDIQRLVPIGFYSGGQRIYHIVASHPNRPGTLHDLLTHLMKHGLDLLSIAATNRDERTGITSLFAVSTGEGFEAAALERTVRECKSVIECSVEADDRGFLFGRPHVLTFGFGERAVLLRQDVFSGLLRRSREMFGSGGETLVFEQGQVSGALEVKNIEVRLGTEFLRSHSRELIHMFKARGWWKAEVAPVRTAGVDVTLRLEGCLDCTGQVSDKPLSQFARGYIAGFDSELRGREVSCTETKCVAVGDPYCEFVISSSERSKPIVKGSEAPPERDIPVPRAGNSLSYTVHFPVIAYSKELQLFQVRARIKNAPGTFADVLQRLAEGGLNLSSAYTTFESGTDVTAFSVFGESSKSRSGRRLEQLVKGISGVVEAAVEGSSDGLLLEKGIYPVAEATGDRLVLFDAHVFSAALSKVRTLLGPGGDLVLFEEGKGAGRAHAKSYVEKFGSEAVRGFAPEFPKGYASLGWSSLDLEIERVNPLLETITMRNCFECEGQKSTVPYSQFTRGHVAGAMETLLGRGVECTEVRCSAKGDDSCVLRVSETT
jgi:predicted hydrocarbon binding protein